ncbi:MAG: LysE family translocator [Hyphomonadaceae bacterium]|nr:LysE family translocator [Hyphomonadaceae bacterium]
MELSTILIAWAAVATLAVLTPGPDTMLVVGHAAKGGLRSGLLAMAGITTGGIWYAALFGFGLLKLLTVTPWLFAIVKTAGAAYLIWLGVQAIRSALRKTPDAPAAPGAIKAGQPFIQGLVTNVLNPKLALLYVAVLPQFIPNGPDGPMIGVALIAINGAIGAVWLSIVAVLAARASGVVRDHPITRWLEGALGVAFIGLGGRLALERS